MHDYEIAAREFASLAQSLGLAMAAEFVPFSRSRNAKDPRPSLNWLCTFTRNGRPLAGLERLDYMQGSGHCPASKAGAKRFPIAADVARAVALECETGKRAGHGVLNGRPYATSAAISPPAMADVLSCLCLDADVIDYVRFEDWASELGYDPDSRKAEATYRACLDIALALRGAIGGDSLDKLRDLAREM